MRHLLLVTILLAACGKHATRDQAQAACEHQIELGYWKGFDEALTKSGHDPKDPAMHAQGVQALPEQQKTDAWKAELATCTDTYADKASPAQIACITAAATSDAATACLK